MILRLGVEISQAVRLREQYTGFLLQKAVKLKSDYKRQIVDEEKGVYNEEDGSMNINPNSKIVLTECYLEPELMKAVSEDKFQFVRNGYFCVDNKDSEQGKPIFNRIVSLKSSFKLQK